MKKTIVSIFCLFATVAFAREFPQNSQMEIYDDLSGGWNTTTPAHKVNKTMSRDMRNVLVDEKLGSLVQRNGYITIGSSRVLSRGSFMFTYTKADGSTEFLVSDSSQILSTKNFTDYTLVQTTWNTSLNIDCETVRDEAWCTNGGDVVFKWDGDDKDILDGSGGNLADVPKGKYIAFWKERVWMGNIAGKNSALRWTDFKSTNGATIAPENFLAWNASNEIGVGEGDGTVITSMWVYRGQLHVGKERSVYVVYGDDSSNFVAVRSVAEVGPISNDVVIVKDGLTYFLADDGFYAYDGSEAVRISDAISDKVEGIFKESSRIIITEWGTESAFTVGSLNNSTVTYSHVENFTGDVTVDQAASPNPTGPIDLTDSTTFYGWVVFTTTMAVANAADYKLKTFRFYGVSIPDVSGQNRDLVYSFRNKRTEEEYSASTITIGGGGFVQYTITADTDTPIWTGEDMYGGNFQIKVEYVNRDGGKTARISVPGQVAQNTQVMLAQSTGQYTSDIATLTSITGWSSFDAVTTLNEGSVDFYIKTSTSLVNIATKTWSSISPGVIINEPTINNYIQWAATISGVSQTLESEINSVSVSHIEGEGNVNRPFGISWNNRVWFAVSTEASGNYNYIYVKSKITNKNPNAWMPFDSINIRSFAKDGEDVLYAGAASTGVFYRLDYGLNDDGKAITSYYVAPRFIGQSTLFDKDFLMYSVYGDRQDGGVLKFAVKKDDGIWNEVERDIGALPNVSVFSETFEGKTGLTLGGLSKFTTLRVKNDALDKRFVVHGMEIIYVPTQIFK